MPRRRRDGAARLRPAADDRRRHDQPRAHGGQDPSALPARAGGLCHRRQPRRRRRRKPHVGAGAAQLRGRHPGGICPHRRGPCARGGGQAAAVAAGRARECAEAQLVGKRGAAAPDLPRLAGAGGLSDRGAARVHRLVAVLRHLGADGEISRHPGRLQIRRGRAQPVRGRAGDARPHRVGALVHRQRRVRLLAGQFRRRRYPGLWRRDAGKADRNAAYAAPAAHPPRRPRQRGARRFRGAARERASRPYRRLHGDGRHRRGRRGRALQARERRLFLDHGQGAGRSPRGGLRRAPAPARAQGILGLCRRTRRSAPRS